MTSSLKRRANSSRFNQPKPSSLIAEHVSAKRKKTHSAPTDSDGRKLNAMARKSYTTAAMSMKIASFLSFLHGKLPGHSVGESISVMEQAIGGMIVKIVDIFQFEALKLAKHL